MPAKCCASSTSTSAYSSFLNLNLLLLNQLQSQTLLFLLQLLQTLLRSLRWTPSNIRHFRHADASGDSFTSQSRGRGLEPLGRVGRVVGGLRAPGVALVDVWGAITS